GDPAQPFQASRLGGSIGRHEFRLGIAASQKQQDGDGFGQQVGRAAGGADLTVTDPRFFTRYLRRAVQGDAKLEAAVEAMDGWNSVYEDKDGDGYYDSPGLTVYRTWIKTAQNEVIGHTVGDWWHKIEDESYIKYQTDVLLRAIEGSDAGAPMTYDWYKGRSKDAVLRKTVA
ncbi:hypothetical protein I6F66_22330, partial [Pseudoalteromonas sp. NZS100_1]|nr:hypothetical protein [Pseudoalteromonas sp. NZS100_1]